MHGVFHVVFGYVFHVCDCVIVCFTLCGKLIHGMMYMGKVIARLLCEKIICMTYVYRKKWNAEVRNHNLRGSENEMNLKVLNFIEINKRSGW